MSFISLVTCSRQRKGGHTVSSLLAPLAIHAGKALITRFIKGRRMRFCPHCGGKVFMRGRTKGN